MSITPTVPSYTLVINVTPKDIEGHPNEHWDYDFNVSCNCPNNLPGLLIAQSMCWPPANDQNSEAPLNLNRNCWPSKVEFDFHNARANPPTAYIIDFKLSSEAVKAGWDNCNWIPVTQCKSSQNQPFSCTLLSGTIMSLSISNPSTLSWSQALLSYKFGIILTATNGTKNNKGKLIVYKSHDPVIVVKSGNGT